MQDDFITETTSETLTILLLSQSDVIVDVVRKNAQKIQIQVEHVSTDLHHWQQFLKKTPDQSLWYRILWWDTPDDSGEVAPQICSWLRKRKELSGAVLLTPFHQSFTHASKTLSTISAQSLYNFQLIEQRSPYVSCFFYKDLLTEQFTIPLAHEIAAYFHSKTYHTNIVFRPFTLEKLTNEVLSQLIIPRGGQRKLIQGSTELSFESLLKEFRKHLPGLLPKSFEQLKKPLIKIEGKIKSIEVAPGFSNQERDQLIIALVKQNLTQIPQTDTALPVSHLPVPKQRTPKLEKVSTFADTQKVSKYLGGVQPIQEQSKKNISRSVITEKPRVISPKRSDKSVNVAESVNYIPRSIAIPVTVPPEIRRSKIVLESIFKTAIKKNTITVDQVRLTPSKNTNSFTHKTVEKAFKPESEKHLDQQISALFAHVIPVANTVQTEKSVSTESFQYVSPKTAKNNTARLSSKLVKLTVIFIMLSGLVWGSFVGNQWFVTNTFNQLESELSQQESPTKMQQRMSWLSAKGLSYQVKAFQPFLSDREVQKWQSVSQSLLHLIPLQNSLADTKTQLVKVLTSIFTPGSASALTLLETLPTQIEESYKQLGNVEAELKQIQSQQVLNPSQDDKVSEVISSISTLKKNLLISQQLTTLAPVVLGKDTPQTFAILLQDNQELRPTGGFIQSVVLVTLKDGKMVDSKSYPSSYFDKELSGVVAPPSDLEKYLGEKNWFFHDANWSGDFAVSSQKAIWFIEKSLSTDIQGVIGMNWLSVQELLKVTGEVSLPEFQDKLTSENLQERVRSHARESATPATTSFSEAAFKAIVDKFVMIAPEQYPQALSLLSQSLSKSEITMYVENPQFQQTLQTFGWSGEVISPLCPAQFAQQECLVSSVYQVDTNVGVNKVNYFIKKKTEAQIELNQLKNYIKLYTTYENSSLIDQWPQGAYKNYVRYYLKPGVENIIVKVNGEIVPKEQLFEEIGTNHQIVGVMIDVPAQQRTIVEISYQEAGVQSPMSYAFFWQKQPGVATSPLNLRISYPDNFLPTLIAPEAKVEAKEIEFNVVGNQHTFAGIRFK